MKTNQMTISMNFLQISKLRYLSISLSILWMANLAFLPSILEAQTISKIDDSTISTDELTNEIVRLMESGKVHGLTISVMNSDQMLYQKAFGTSNIVEGTDLKMTDGFYGASFSKAVFAYIVMKLVDEGKIDLDTPIQEYLDKPLPDYEFEKSFEGYQNLKGDERYKQFTPRMLLSHSSGLPNWRYIGKMGINMNRELELEFDPGTWYGYSGEGIYLLQFIVEQITGEGLEDLAQRYVFEPFDMGMTSYLWQDRFEGKRAFGHYKKKKMVPTQRRDEANAAGSMETTPEDYAKFMNAVLNAKGLSAGSFKEMTSAQVRIKSLQQFGSNRFEEVDNYDDIELSYGLGWGVYQTPHGKAVFKEGHIEGWEHYSILYPENDLAVVIMCNSSNGESIFNELIEVTAGDTWLPWYWELFYPYNM